jgi:peptide/nickel transport system permease protein
MAGGVLLLAIIVAVLLGPLVVPYSPTALDPSQRLQGPSREHLLGTDQVGRDLLARLLYGGRVSLGSALPAVLGLVLLGLVVGAVAGYAGGLVDGIIAVVIDTVLALPGLVLSLAIAGTLGPSLRNTLLAVLLVGWAGHARLFRGAVLAAREWEYVVAARAAGAGNVRIVARHILPNIIGPIIVVATLDIGFVILTISSLSFLGLGVQPPTPEWGVMLSDARTSLDLAPQLVVLPALCILLVVLAANLLGDGLRDALDPRKVMSSRTATADGAAAAAGGPDA